MLPGSMQNHPGLKKHVQEDEKQSWRAGGGGLDSVSKHVSKHDESTKVIRKTMPCWAWVQPSFDASSAPGSCAQSHEILLNKGMKYWDSGLHARGLRTFTATANIAAAAVIGWMRSVKQGQGKLSWAPNLFLNWVSCPVEAQCTFFSCFLKISSPMRPNRGFEFHAPLKPSVLFPSVFWNLIPCVTIPGVSVPSFPHFMPQDKPLELQANMLKPRDEMIKNIISLR